MQIHSNSQMVETINKECNLTGHLTGISKLPLPVEQALRKVPRNEFVQACGYDDSLAYSNSPLPIGYDQTISQPFIVALMTALLEPKKTDKILEIGTGSGYQAAILAELAGSVYTIERVRSRERLKK